MIVTAEIIITSFRPGPTGGGVALGKDVNNLLRRAIIKYKNLPRDPAKGECWRFTGVSIFHPEYGEQIEATVALPLIPNGSALVRYLAENPSIKGVGPRYAERLWDEFGPGLYNLIASRDASKLASVVGVELAIEIIEGFGLLAEEVKVFEFFDRYGVDARTAGAAAAIWGSGAIDLITKDPYALALVERWETVDLRAKLLGVAIDDERRLLAMVDEAGARRWRSKHTASKQSDLAAIVRSLLGMQFDHLANRAIQLAIRHGRLIETTPGLWQTRGAAFMERTVVEAIARRLARQTASSDADAIARAIHNVENSDQIQLAGKQWDAVIMAVTSPLSLISGGGGTGKTTVAKAILAAVRSRGGSISQIALAGRAAKRMAEATGAQAMTIHRFLRLLSIGTAPVAAGGLLIIDESSMIDLPHVYRILRELPEEVDICFIGDQGQLPPIGPGLVFHILVNNAAIPHVILDQIHRHSLDSGIPQVAAAIRSGTWPDLPDFDPTNPFAEGVFIAKCQPAKTAESTVEIWEAFVGPPPVHDDQAARDFIHECDVQILAATRNQLAGTKALCEIIDKRWMANQPRIGEWGLSLGSKILWLKNDYNRKTGVAPNGDDITIDIMNGTLGVIRASTDNGAIVDFDDGLEDEIRVHDLIKLERGWAISIHKAQGSAWRRVIIPITESRLLDRTLIYTALTRARYTVVLVGDEALMKKAVVAPPSALRRTIALSPKRMVGHI